MNLRFLAAWVAAGALAGACADEPGDTSSDAKDGSPTEGGKDASSEVPSAGGKDAEPDEGLASSSDVAVEAPASDEDAAPEGGIDASVVDSGGLADVVPDTDAGDAGPKFPVYPEVPFPTENPFTADKATLGKILFWEEQIGSDDTMACGTCHRAEAGGSDPRASQAASLLPGPDAVTGTDDDIRGARGLVACDSTGTKTGTEPQVTGRKPPTYLDAMFAPAVFWDGRASGTFIDPGTSTVAIASGGALESQAVGPPMAATEMACADRTWPDVVTKLETAQPLKIARNIPTDMEDFIADHSTYPKMFEFVFGKPATGSAITVRRIAFAIATHERRLTSNQTPWDRWNDGDESALTATQKHGFELFMSKGKCNVCHAPPLFTNNNFHFIGFHEKDWDIGREKVTGNTLDRGKVKTATLRNVGLREKGGLLHTGAGPGESLDSIMKLYNDGGRAGVTDIDPAIVPLKLTQTEIDAIIDFMRNGLTDPRVSGKLPPFDHPKLCTEGTRTDCPEK